MDGIQNKVVFITGASSGIGAALAEDFAAQGAHLALAARRAARLEALSEKCQKLGVKALALPCDVTDAQAVSRAVSQAREHFGRLDIVIANAGYGVVGNLADLKIEDYRRQFETNIFGVLNTIYSSLEALKASKGRLAVVGSINGHVSLPGGSSYAMSKFAIRALCDSLWYELAPHGISVTLISPGFVASEIRVVDNRGVHHPHTKDPIPRWLVVPTPKAARQMVKAIMRRRPEAIITGHGKVIVFLQRHFHWLVRWITGVSRLSARPQTH